MKNIDKIAQRLSEETVKPPKREYPRLQKGHGYILEYFIYGKKVFEKVIKDVFIPEVENDIGKRGHRRVTDNIAESIAQSCFRSFHDIGFKEGLLFDKISVLVDLRYDTGLDYDICITSYDRTGKPRRRGISKS